LFEGTIPVSRFAADAKRQLHCKQADDKVHHPRITEPRDLLNPGSGGHLLHPQSQNYQFTSPGAA